MHFDVIVIGGGAIGAGCAYQLAKNNLDVLLLEKRRVGSGASGSSAAMLEHQIDAHRNEPFFSLSHASNALFPSLYAEIKELTQMDFQLEKCGIMQLALGEDDATFLTAEVKRQKQIGLAAEWLEPEQLEKELPLLNTIYQGAALYQEDGQVNGEILTASLMKAAELKGATIYENLGELALNLTDGKITNVMTSQGNYSADKFILCAGSWSDSLLDPLGVRLGIVPVRGQLIVYDTPKRLLKFPIYTRKNGYITPKQNGFTFVGSTVEKVGFDETCTEKARTELTGIAQQLMPSLARQPIRGMIAGLRPASPDSLPFLGSLPGYENLIIATGHYRNGILLTPITAQIVAALILGQQPPVNIAPFSPVRFSGNKNDSY